MVFVRGDSELRRIIRQNYILFMQTENYDNECLQHTSGIRNSPNDGGDERHQLAERNQADRGEDGQGTQEAENLGQGPGKMERPGFQ